MFITVATFQRGQIPHATTFLAAGDTLAQAIREHMAEKHSFITEKAKTIHLGPDMAVVLYGGDRDWREVITSGPDLGTLFQEACKRLEGAPES